MNSWINVGTETPPAKWVIGGATTWRDWYNPGSLRSTCTLYKNEGYAAFADSRPQWGYTVKIQTRKLKFPSSEVWPWRAHGGHWYGNEWYYTDCPVLF